MKNIEREMKGRRRRNIDTMEMKDACDTRKRKRGWKASRKI